MSGAPIAARSGRFRDVSRDALVERIVASPAFLKSARMRELLVFLCERALEGGDQAVRESEIGAAVFGRQPGYDTTQDPLVRVQVSQLRKRLQQYFENEGKEEPVIVEIPRGTYTPVFLKRQTEEIAAPPAIETAPASPARVSRLTLFCAGLAAISLAVAVWALLRHQPTPEASAAPTVNRLWSQFLENGQPACILISDPGLLMFENLVRRGLSLTEYRNKEFEQIAQAQIADPVRRDDALNVMVAPFSHKGDSQLVATLAVLNAAHRARSDVVPARDFEVSYLRSHNVIMLGSRLSNPWMEMFESQLNFRSVIPDTPDHIYFQNSEVRPGESKAYHLDWGRSGYCRVALLPNPNHNGNVLLISGTDMAATEAGGAFITGEPWVRLLRSTLGLRDRAPFPAFEILLKVDYLARNAAPRFSIAGWRRPKP
jgi:hypothetical protein